MSNATVNLDLPYLMPSQAMKHVIHNEALQRLDAVAQLRLDDRLSAPPGEAEEGACFVILPGATGAWSGHDGRLAVRQDGAWTVVRPRRGWLAFDQADERVKLFDGDEWQEVPQAPHARLSTLGIEATADGTNRLAVASEASLFSHAGASHRMKINKQAEGDTASLLFQTDWQGRVEIGTAGDDGLSIRVSGDGASWTTVLSADADGRVDLPTRPAARAALTAGTSTPADGSFSGFDALAVAQGGFALGAALPSGPGLRLPVPADGLYLVTLSLSVGTSTGHQATVAVNGTAALAALAGSNAGGLPWRQSASTLAMLAAGDWLSLQHGGDAQVHFGPGATEISLYRL